MTKTILRRVVAGACSAVEKAPRVDMSGRKARVLATVLGLAAALPAVMIVRAFPNPPVAGVVPWWSLVLVFFAAEWYSIVAQRRSALAWLSCHEAGVVLGLFLVPAAGVLAAQLLGALLALVSFGRDRVRFAQVAARLGVLALATPVAVFVFFAFPHLGDPTGPAAWIAAALAALAGAGVTVGLTALIVSGEARTDSIRRSLGRALAASVASAAIGIVAVELVRAGEAAALLLALPFVSSALALRAYASERRRLEHLRGLYESMRMAQRAHGLESVVSELLASTRRLLQAEAVLIILFPRDASQSRLRAELSTAGERRLGPAALSRAEELAVRAAVQAQGVIELTARAAPRGLGVLLASRKLDRALLTALRGERGVHGVLLVGNRHDSLSYGAEEERLFETYARHAGVLLENDHLEQSLTELTALKEQLRHQAYHDALTGLPNRSLFAERVARSLNSGEGSRSAVLFVDLDDFKMVNDTMGHAAGDELLVSVAQRVKRCIRPSDVPARLGGDEFAVLAEIIRPEDAERIAARLVEALERPFVIQGQEMPVHASVGIAYGAAGQTSADELLRNADVAMYDAKQGGKRRYASYRPQMHEHVRRRHDLASALERAVDREEIDVHYQPIVDLATRKVVAVEALARWQRNGHGLVQPASFIPLADEIGLMVQIGRVVLLESCRQARSWQTSFSGHEELTMNVNLAPSELHDESLADDVAAILEETGLAPERLVLEITESGVMLNPDDALRTMHRLRGLGVSLALDDFGTGHSSLAHLREFPIDSLKIAKPFVDGLPANQVDAAFVETIVRLGSSLDLSVVAEGIESAAQAEAVAQIGCAYGQGYFFGTPAAQLGVTSYLTAPALPSQPQPAAVRAA